jgi:hypothetical protein
MEGVKRNARGEDDKEKAREILRNLGYKPPQEPYNESLTTLMSGRRCGGNPSPIIKHTMVATTTSSSHGTAQQYGYRSMSQVWVFQVFGYLLGRDIPYAA